jgi:nucleoid-associated protein YgaU
MNSQTGSSTRWLDIFKAAILLILLLAALLLFRRDSQAVRSSTEEPRASVTPGNVSKPQMGAPVSSSDGSFTLSGTATPGSQVVLLASGTELGTVDVSADGTWSFTGSLPPGEYEVLAVEVDSAGTPMGVSTPLAISVPAPAPYPSAGEAPQPATSAIGEYEVSESGMVTVTGTGEPGASVVILQDGTVVSSTTVQADGTFSLTFQSTPGEHILTVQIEGQVETVSATTSIQVANPEPSEKAKSSAGQVYIVQQGDWLMDLSRRFYGDPSRWTDIFTATNARATEDSSFAKIKDPRFILPGWKLWIPDK